MPRRLAPGSGCGLCGARDWGWDDNLGRWQCLTCQWKGRPKPEVPVFSEAFNFDNWYSACMAEYEDCASRLSEMESKVEPDGDAQKIIHRAELRRLHREYDQALELSSVSMYLKHIREMSIAKGCDVYVNLPTIELQIRFGASTGS